MKVMLVWPPGSEVEATIPISLAYLHSNFNHERHTLKLVDCSLDRLDPNSLEFEKILKEFQPDIVGVSGFSTTFRQAMDVMKASKRFNPKVITIIGGAHASSYPKLTMDNFEIDFLFQGEAEHGLNQFVDELEKEKPDFTKIQGLAYRNEEGAVIFNKICWIENLDTVRHPDLDAIRMDDYIKGGYRFYGNENRCTVMQVTRGCPYKCTFCSAPVINGTQLRRHSIPYLIEHIKYLYEVKNIRWINIIDDNFTLHVPFAKEFCREVIKLNLKGLHFATTNGIRMERGDPELWGLMKQAGWLSITIAPESGSPKTLEKMQKKLDLTQVPRITNEIRAAGLKVYAFIIVGYPGETMEDIKLTKKLMQTCKFDFAHVFCFQPLPGTPIYNELVAEGKIKNTLLPEHYSRGKLVYRTPGLENFNFPLFMFSYYVGFAMRHPILAIKQFMMYRPTLILRRLFQLLTGAIKIKQPYKPKDLIEVAN